MPFVFALLLTAGFNPTSLTVNLDVATSTVRDHSTTTLRAYASTTASAAGLRVDRFLRTIECESRWRWDAVSHTNDFGVMQINARWHPDITREQMLDPYWSIDWAVKQWVEGRQNAWVCYTNLYGKTM